jgi:hypothetical protein
MKSVKVNLIKKDGTKVKALIKPRKKDEKKQRGNKYA